MKKAFTLIEMVIVIVLLGILAAIIVPSQTSYVSAAKGTQAVAVNRNFKTTFQSFQNLSASNLTQAVKNDHAYETTALPVVFVAGGTISTVDGTAVATLDNAACSKLLQAFGNLAAGDIAADTTLTWKAASTATTECTFTHNPSSQQFTFNNSTGVVSGLSSS